MKAVTPIPFVRAKFTDKCGKPLAGGKVYTYEANTTTLKATYKDPYGLTENTNPIVLDSAGEADIYLHGTYRIRIMSRNDVIVNDVDKIGSWYSSGLQDTLNNISNGMNEQLKPLLDAAAALGAGKNGWLSNIVATNITDASTQNLFNQKGVTTVESVAGLAKLDVWDGRTVNVSGFGSHIYSKSEDKWLSSSSIDLDTIDDLKKFNPILTTKYARVQRYYDISDARSGGKFHYDEADTTTPEDGVFVFTSNVLSGRWKRVLDNTTINITQGGLIGFGEESDKLNNLLKACENQSTVLNYSRKFMVDGLQMRVNTSKQINLNLTLAKMKDIDILSTLPDQTAYNKDTGCGLYVYGTDSWTNNQATYRRKTKEYLSGVTVSASLSNGKNTLGLYLQPDSVGQFANSIFEQVNVEGFDYSLVLTSNCFLINFNECDFVGANNYNITTSTLLGIDTSLANMGENIKFTNCTLSNCVQGVLKLDAEMWLTFNACSFDYHGKSTDMTAWFELLGNVSLNLIACHYESGNDYAQLGDKLFYTNNNQASVKLIGGTFSMGDKNNNNYVFYSDNPLNQNFSVENVWVWGGGLAKKAWSNTGMGRFRIATNTGVGMGNVKANAIQAPNKTLTKDYNFAKSALMNKLVDKWWSSSDVVLQASTTIDNNGKTIPCLKATPSKADQTLQLLIKRPTMRNACSPAFRINGKVSKDISGIYLSVLPVDVVDSESSLPSIISTRWSETSEFGKDLLVNPTTSFSDLNYFNSSRTFLNLETFDYYLVTIKFAQWYNVDFIFSTVECYDMDN